MGHMKTISTTICQIQLG